MKCAVCNDNNLELILERLGQSITSISEMVDYPTKVYICRECGHAQTELRVIPEEYYENSYRLHLDSENDDDIIILDSGKTIYRSQYQIDILSIKTQLENCKHLLEYGAGRGNCIKRLFKDYGSISLFAFDIAKQHLALWEKFIPKEQCAYRDTPISWKNKMDLVFSSFVLEHCDDPIDVLMKMYDLINDSGKIIIIVPNPYYNNIDLLAVDHVNHFSKNSLCHAAKLANLQVTEIDDEIQLGAYWVTMTKNHSEQSMGLYPLNVNDFLNIGDWFMRSEKEMVKFATSNIHDGIDVYIYGSGVWGAFVLSALNDKVKISGFIDRNPTLQGKNAHGIQVYSPGDINDCGALIICALNPKVASNAMLSVFPKLYSIGSVFTFKE